MREVSEEFASGYKNGYKDGFIACHADAKDGTQHAHASTGFYKSSHVPTPKEGRSIRY